MKKLIICSIGILFFIVGTTFTVVASEEEEPFDAKEAIFEHLLDNYGWEVPFSHSTRIPLPVIIRDNEGSSHP